MQQINNYREFVAKESFNGVLRALFRNVVIRGLSFTKNINDQNNWVRFPYYHHIFDDERIGFKNQLKYLKNFGDFISMDDACRLLSEKSPVKGRYWCVSFDDGFYNCYSNMMEITSALKVPVIIYLPVNFIGLDPAKADDEKRIANFYPENPRLVPFLSWENCKAMLAHQVSFGSHTCSHANLSKITAAEIETELVLSKKIIEDKLGVKCNHFACPWGRPGIDFFPEQTTSIAQKAGYISFSTTARGKMIAGDDLFLLKRDHLLANWENYQLKYFFSL